MVHQWSDPVDRLLTKTFEKLSEKMIFFKKPQSILLTHPGVKGIKKVINRDYPDAILHEYQCQQPTIEWEKLGLVGREIDLVVSHMVINDQAWLMQHILAVSSYLKPGCPWIFSCIGDSSGILRSSEVMPSAYGWTSGAQDPETLLSFLQIQGFKNPVFERFRFICQYPSSQYLLEDCVELHKNLVLNSGCDRKVLMAQLEEVCGSEKKPLDYALDMVLGVVLQTDKIDVDLSGHDSEYPIDWAGLKKNSDRK